MGPGNAPRWNAPFVGIPSFLRSVIATDLDRLDADIAVMGVPSDEGSPFMPGSRFGPRGIREHSMRFGARGQGYYDPFSVFTKRLKIAAPGKYGFYAVTEHHN